MTADILGPAYTVREIPLPPDEEGEVVATLVTRRADAPTRRAVLYVHGYVDYFFHDHVAELWVTEGFDFYALDLRKCGRSLRPHQTPSYAADLAEYDEELDEAARIIRDEDGHDVVVIMAHSMGGLVTSLWADRRGGDVAVDGLILNSPWLGPQLAPWTQRNAGTLRAVEMLGARRPRTLLPMRLPARAGLTTHRDHRGQWDYNLDWKPIGGFPAYAGFGRALVRAQRQVARGLDLRCPVLLACSMRSAGAGQPDEVVMAADDLLDVDAMVARGARLGRHVTIARIDGGRHDLALSATEPRERYLAEVRRWTSVYVPLSP